MNKFKYHILTPREENLFWRFKNIIFSFCINFNLIMIKILKTIKYFCLT